MRNNINKFFRLFYNFNNKIQFLIFIILFNIKDLFKAKNYPYKITIKLNNNCNLNCLHCYIWKNKEKNEINFDNLKNFLNNYGKKIRILSFTGGEIFLIKDIESRIDYSLNKCKNLNIFSLTTNGFFTNKIINTIENLLIKYPKIIITINISIDGEEELHNKLRGNKLSYKNAIETYKKLNLLKNKLPNLEVNQEFLLSEDTKHLLENKIKNKNTIISIIQESNFYGNIKINKNIKISRKEVKNTKGYLKKKFLKGYLRNNYNCYAIKSSLFIDWNGDIKPCIIWNKKLGNIKKINLINEFNNKKFTEIENNIKQKRCPGCWTPCEGYLSIIHQFWKNNF